MTRRAEISCGSWSYLQECSPILSPNLFEGRQYVAVALGGGEDVDQIIGLTLTGVEP